MLGNLKLGDMNAALGNCAVDMNPTLVILQNNVTLISTVSPIEVKRSRAVRAVEPNSDIRVYHMAKTKPSPRKAARIRGLTNNFKSRLRDDAHTLFLL